MEKLELLCSAGRKAKTVQPLWKTGWQLLKELKTELSLDPTVPLWGMYPKEPKTRSQRAIYTAMFTASFRITIMWKQPRCPPLDEWIRKMEYTQPTE